MRASGRWARLGVLAAAGAIAACGGGDRDDAAGTGPAETASPAPTSSATATARRGVRLVTVGRFDSPVYVTSPPGDTRRLFVVEQGGRIRVVRDGRVQRRPFLDITGKVTAGGEQGLLSVAFAPDYATSRRFYVYYTNRSGDQDIVEYRAASGERADPGSARRLMRMADDEVNHNGGLLLFGPDGKLYVGTGDGGGGGDLHGERGNAQDLGSLLGKILRIDPVAVDGRPYGVPADNPFVDREGARPEIFAYGLRNPWRFSFDGESGPLTIGDVGQDEIEEIDVVSRERARGANFGWRPFEGRTKYTRGEEAPGQVGPAVQRRHDDGWCSVTGGVVVRDRAVPGLYGRYLFGDFCAPEIESARLAGGRARDVRRTGLEVENLSSFGQDAAGRVYLVSLGGPVYRLAAR